METILKVSNLTKRFSDFALQDVSLSLPGGAIMGMIGENGAGKTTMIRLILGLMKRDAGEVSLFGNPEGIKDAGIREQIGVVFDDCRFHCTFNAMEVGKIHKNMYPHWDGEYYRHLCSRFFLPEKKKIKDYSKGMKMKLSIAAALSHHPKLLLLDEPTSGLDPVARDDLLEIFQDFISDEEHSIVFSSHITSDLEKIADYIAFLKKGKLCFSLEKEELRESFSLLQCGEELLRWEPLNEKTAGIRKGRFGCEALLRCGAAEAKKLLAQEGKGGEITAVVEIPSLEDIMLLYEGGLN